MHTKTQSEVNPLAISAAFPCPISINRDKLTGMLGGFFRAVLVDLVSSALLVEIVWPDTRMPDQFCAQRV